MSTKLELGQIKVHLRHFQTHVGTNLYTMTSLGTPNVCHCWKVVIVLSYHYVTNISTERHGFCWKTVAIRRAGLTIRPTMQKKTWVYEEKGAFKGKKWEKGGLRNLKRDLQFIKRR